MCVVIPRRVIGKERARDELLSYHTLEFIYQSLGVSFLLSFFSSPSSFSTLSTTLSSKGIEREREGENHQSEEKYKIIFFSHSFLLVVVVVIIFYFDLLLSGMNKTTSEETSTIDCLSSSFLRIL